jgi:hypothetical protein
MDWRDGVPCHDGQPRTFIYIAMESLLISGILFGADLDLMSLAGSSNYDIVFLSTQKHPSEDFKEWNEGSSATNIMLIKWEGDYAERVAVGHIGHHVFEYLVGNHDEKSMYKWGYRFRETTKWKTIKLR